MAELPPALDPADWTTHVAFVRRLARSLVSDRADADDLEQEAWLAWMRSPPDRTGASRGWLARVLANLARMGARSRTRREAREQAAVAHEPRHAAAADESVAQIELHRRVVERVLALAEPYRAVVVLRYFEQRSLGEIAQRLALPLETVKTRQKRALQQLRAELLGGDAGERDPRRRALLALAQGTGALVMTTGTKWAVGTAAALVIACVAARSWWWPGEATPALQVAAREAAAEPEPALALPAPVEAMREAAPAALPAAETTAILSKTTPRRTIEALIRGDVRDEEGRPLPTRRVELYERSRNVANQFDRLVATTLTDAEGLFDFGVSHLERRAGATVVAWDGETFTGLGIDATAPAVVHLVIGKTKAIFGRVVDERGAPVAGATLSIYGHFGDGRLNAGFLVPAAVARRTTVSSEPDGSFAVEGLPRGWQVALSVARGGFATYRETFTLDESPDDLETVIVLRDACAIEGVVTSADGRPVADLCVGAQIAEGTFRERSTWGQATTDSEGRYRIDGLEAGSWNVFVCLDQEQQQRTCAAPAQSVELTAKEPLAKIAFVLPLGGELVIKVMEATTRAPIRDFWIGVQSTATSRSGAAVQALITDDDGVGRLRLPPGQFRAYLGGDVPAPSWSSKVGIIDEGGTLDWTLEIGGGVTLRGIVRLPDGRPAADAAVWVVESAFRRIDSGKTTTRADGSFELASLPPADSWRVCAATAGAAMVDPLVADAATMALDQLELRLVARPPTRVVGRVVGHDGKGFAAAIVSACVRHSDSELGQLNTPDPAQSAVTDAEGRFEFRGFWSDTRYSLSAVWLDRRGGETQVHHGNGEVPPLDRDETHDLGDLVLQLRDDGR